MSLYNNIILIITHLSTPKSTQVQKQRAHQAAAEAEARRNSQYKSPPRAGGGVQNHIEDSYAAYAPQDSSLNSSSNGGNNDNNGNNGNNNSNSLSPGRSFVEKVQAREVDAGGSGRARPPPMAGVRMGAGGASAGAGGVYAYGGGDSMQQQYQHYQQERTEYMPPSRERGGSRGVDHFRPTSAEEVDSFLVNWQRQINMPQARAGEGIPVVPPAVRSSGNYSQQQQQYTHRQERQEREYSNNNNNSNIDAYSNSNSNSNRDSHVRDRSSYARESDDGVRVSLVSDSRLIPANPWEDSGLLAALGPGGKKGGNGGGGNSSDGHGQGIDSSIEYIRSSAAGGGLAAPTQDQSFTLPSERGQVQPRHLQAIGIEAQAMEKSLTSDSMLM